jgi:hypothetical protein
LLQSSSGISEGQPAVQLSADDPSRTVWTGSAAQNVSRQWHLAREAGGHLTIAGQLNTAEHFINEAANLLIDSSDKLIDPLLDETLDNVVEGRAGAAARRSGE